ncbi:hypothetical protein EV193_11185 [Herbihabitans rhizosphaerae]|uniref:Type VII secretion system (Wss) protein ESAT-6 n=2 Tax=Herbihabitans rhizosphaerae TaxID=1872711 RepID=A0A4Q7KFP3_9PSEU|nr:hypothetical protein EV193_11185 [Herbihabitans rhizosphaerae]
MSNADYISLSHWILWGVKQVCGCNPAEWIAKQVTGDWERVAKAGDALVKLADFNEAYANNITIASDAMLKQWDGNAADAANRYFDNLATTLVRQKSALKQTAAEFRNLAYSVWGLAKTITGLLEDLADWIGVWVCTKLAELVPNPFTKIFSAAAAAFALAKAEAAWAKIVAAEKRMLNMVHGGCGTIAGCLGAIGAVKEHRLPGTYDHPGASA